MCYTDWTLYYDKNIFYVVLKLYKSHLVVILASKRVFILSCICIIIILSHNSQQILLLWLSILTSWFKPEVVSMTANITSFITDTHVTSNTVMLSFLHVFGLLEWTGAPTRTRGEHANAATEMNNNTVIIILHVFLLFIYRIITNILIIIQIKILYKHLYIW